MFGYDINDYDPYGNPDVHSRHEESDGKVVKGNIWNRMNFYLGHVKEI